ncbi:dihydropteroate synthase [Megasphaera elsdenii]|uniref:dihydropteroate synthase n=1 Tax=Megasphaera elsdenii TaxID=907 RepID=UPI0006C82531|nr:dihydropteroate synthase [Megasphaera elsdenii]ALG41414.1 dihydropteroate synthase [Megasphaera elsdenii 14-14]MCI6925130.1 dihydropteroate synthase [Megasphaera elsdenii]MDD7070905.1 dihydropteroate synthase [Megasphaera elsdenii]MDY5385839.1 dihydropteroate synthase [Megasphaera elsdenii]
MEVRHYHWKDGKSLIVGERTLVMGVLNYTPDSFSDGGKWNNVDVALKHMEEMVADGADIIDIGAESSRPGFTPISAAEEIARLETILPRLVAACPVPISVDTYKAETAEYAMSTGAHIMNDIWGLQYAPEPGKMAAVAAKYGVPVVVMHNQEGTEYDDIIEDMKRFFIRSAIIADQAGMSQDQIITDPGIGFGKDFDQNVYVMKHLQELTALPYPMLLGTSRKGFIGKILDLPVTERMEGTGTTCVAGVLAGCTIVRVHDVKPIVRMCKMADALRPEK